MKRTLRLAALVALSFFFTGCFQILHVLMLGKDGQLDVRWRIAVSSALEDAGGGGPMGPGAVPQQSPAEKLSEMEGELKTSYAQIADRLEVQELKTEFNSGMDLNLSVKNLEKLEGLNLESEEFPVLPRYDAENKRLVFHFTADATREAGGAPALPRKPRAGDDADDSDEMSEGGMESEENGSGAQPGGDMAAGMEKITEMVLAGVTYDLVLGGEFRPRAAYIQSAGGGERTDLEILPLGDEFLIRFPLMLIAMQAQEDFEVVIQL